MVFANVGDFVTLDNPSDYDDDIAELMGDLRDENLSASEKEELQKELKTLQDKQKQAVEARRTNEALDQRVRAVEADVARQQRRQMSYGGYGWAKGVKATKVEVAFSFDAETGAQKMSLNIESAPEKHISDFVDYSAARKPEDFEALRQQEKQATEKLPKYMSDDALAKLLGFVKACTGVEERAGAGNGNYVEDSGGMFKR